MGENWLFMQLTKRLVERALPAETGQHLGQAKNDNVANEAGNTRNGKSPKTPKGEFGGLPIQIQHYCHSSFEPQIIPKNQRRWDGFNENFFPSMPVE